MTQVASTVSVPFTANVGGFLGGMKSATGALDKFGITTGKVGGSLNKMGAAVAAVSVGLAGLRVAQKSVETFKAFETAMVRVGAVSRATASEMDSLAKKTNEVAVATTFTATEIAEGMGFMAMAGMDVATILDSVTHAANLAMSAQIGMAEASDIVTNIMKSMGIETEQLSEAVDLLVATQARANVTVRMLGEGMKYVGPLAKSAGLTLTEVSAAMGNLGNAGIQASMAGTTMRQAIQNMMNPAKRAREAMDELGVSFVNSEGKLRPFVDILRDLENASMSTEQILKLFGVRAGPGMAALISQGADSFQKLHDDIQDAGAAARIAEDVMGSLAGKQNQLAAATENLEIKIGAGLAPTLKAFTDDLRFAVEGLANLDSRFFKSKTGILALTVAIGGLVFAIGPMLAGLAAAGSAVATLAGSLGFAGSMAVLAAASLGTFLGLGEFDLDGKLQKQNDAREHQIGLMKQQTKIQEDLNKLAEDMTTASMMGQSGGFDAGKAGALVKAAEALNKEAGQSLVHIPEVIADTLGLNSAVDEQREAAKRAAQAVEKMASSTKDVGDKAETASKKLAAMATTFQTSESQQGVAEIQAVMFGLGMTSDVDAEQVSLDQQVAGMTSEIGDADNAFEEVTDDVKKLGEQTQKTTDNMAGAANAVSTIGNVLSGRNLGQTIGSLFGPLGSAIGGVVDMIGQFAPSMGKLIGSLLGIVLTLAGVLDPLFEALIPTVAMVGAAVTALAPALHAIISFVSVFSEAGLTAVVGTLAIVIIAIGSALTYLLIQLEKALDFFGSGFLSDDELTDLEREIDRNMDKISTISTMITDPNIDTDLVTAALGDGLEMDLGEWDASTGNVNDLGSAANGAATSLNRLTESVLNAPSGFKLAGYAFDAAEGGVPSSTGGGSTIINVNQINDPDTVRAMLDESRRRESYGGGGSPLPI